MKSGLHALRLWDESSPVQRPPVDLTDVGWAVFALGLALLEIVLRPELPPTRPQTWLTAGSMLTLLGRRRCPLAMVVLAFGVQLALDMFLTDPVADTEGPYAAAILLALPHALYRWGASQQIVVGTLVIAAVAAAGLAEASLAAVLGSAALLVAPMAWGTAGRLRSRAERLALAQVKLQERERLARELHDTVAHHVSAIAIRAQAGQALANLQPGVVEESLQLVQAEARQGLDEIRALVGQGIQPSETIIGGLDDLRRLASRGLPSVAVALHGDLADLAPEVAAALFGIARESVTNARRHGRSVSQISVDVLARPTTVELTVQDNGAKPAGEVIPGFGLTGMRERAALVGGVCAWVSPTEGGFKVQASLPKRGCE